MSVQNTNRQAYRGTHTQSDPSPFTDHSDHSPMAVGSVTDRDVTGFHPNPDSHTLTPTHLHTHTAAEEHIGHGGAGVTIGEGGHGQDGGTRNPISAYAVDSDDDDDTHAASVKAQARRTMKNGGGDDGGAGTIKPSFGKRLSVGVSNLMGFTATNMTAEQGEAGRDGVAQNDIDVLQNSSSIMLMGYL